MLLVLLVLTGAKMHLGTRGKMLLLLLLLLLGLKLLWNIEPLLLLLGTLAAVFELVVVLVLVLLVLLLEPSRAFAI